MLLGRCTFATICDMVIRNLASLGRGHLAFGALVMGHTGVWGLDKSIYWTGWRTARKFLPSKAPYI